MISGFQITNYKSPITNSPCGFVQTMLAGRLRHSDSTCAACGCAMSHPCRASVHGQPAPSLPMIWLSGRFHETWGKGVSTCDEVASRRNAFCAQHRNPFHGRNLQERQIEKSIPRGAKTFQLYGLTVPSVKKEAGAPKASAERRSVPRLPGPASLRPRAAGRHLRDRATERQTKLAILSSAATPWGASLGTMELKSAFGKMSVSVHALIWGRSFFGKRRADSLKNTLSNCWPLRNASSSSLTPSMAHSPRTVGSARRMPTAIPSAAGCGVRRPRANGRVGCWFARALPRPWRPASSIGFRTDVCTFIVYRTMP